MKKYTKEDEFLFDGDAASATARLIQHFRETGMKPTKTDSGVRVRTGSDLVFRLFGAAMSPGANNLPAALDVTVTEKTHGTAISSKAYDRLGPYLNGKLWWGGDEQMTEKLNGLLVEVRAALGQTTETDPGSPPD